MGCIQDAAVKIENLKISNTYSIVIHALNNLDIYFWLHLPILSHDIQEKENLLVLSEQTTSLKDEQMRLLNKNKKIANYAHSLKHKKSKPSEQKEKGGRDKEFDNEREIKKQKVKICKTSRKKCKKNCWHLKIECFICYKMRHVVAKYS